MKASRSNIIFKNLDEDKISKILKVRVRPGPPLGRVFIAGSPLVRGSCNRIFKRGLDKYFQFYKLS